MMLKFIIIFSLECLFVISIIPKSIIKELNTFSYIDNDHGVEIKNIPVNWKILYDHDDRTITICYRDYFSKEGYYQRQIMEIYIADFSRYHRHCELGERWASKGIYKFRRSSKWDGTDKLIYFDFQTGRIFDYKTLSTPTGRSAFVIIRALIDLKYREWFEENFKIYWDDNKPPLVTRCTSTITKEPYPDWCPQGIEIFPGGTLWSFVTSKYFKEKYYLVDRDGVPLKTQQVIDWIKEQMPYKKRNINRIKEGKKLYIPFIRKKRKKKKFDLYKFIKKIKKEEEKIMKSVKVKDSKYCHF